MTGLISANQKVVNYSLTDECFHGMGTTIVMAICFCDVYYIFNVGDSRAYYWKPENLELSIVTKEHTLENKLLTEGYGQNAIDPQYKHILTRWIGSPKLQIDSIDTKKDTWSKNDCILLCSDGLPNMLSNNEICSIIAGNIQEGPQRVCDVLVERGINKGGYDNITTIFIQNKN
jgi:protein phosphatase